MATAHVELIDGIVLTQDLYKDNTLILKKGIVLDTYLLNKLNKFGISTDELDFRIVQSGNFEKNTKPAVEVLIWQKNNFKAHRTRSILNYAGYDNEKILLVNSVDNLNYKIKNISLVFVDSVFYNQDLIEKLTLIAHNKKINVFVLNCDEFCPPDLIYNMDLMNVKYLYRPLAAHYINALLKLYS